MAIIDCPADNEDSVRVTRPDGSFEYRGVSDFGGGSGGDFTESGREVVDRVITDDLTGAELVVEVYESVTMAGDEGQLILRFDV